jgi:CubicO group peptidase (beta-lactamase class C family)
MYKEYVENLIQNKELPGAVLCVIEKKKLLCLEEYGSFTNKTKQQQRVKKDTLFDVASLTKVAATLPSILYLISRGELKLTRAVKEYLPEFRHSDVLIEHLLTHSSGLKPDLPYKERDQKRDVVAEIYQAELQQPPGSKVFYSDLGMILLGKVIEKAAGEPLDTFADNHVFTPWGLKQTRFNLPDNLKSLAASTERYKGDYIQGEVHDEKAFQLGGVSGSAGLFSTAEDISVFARHFLYPEEQSSIPAHLLRLAATHRLANRGLGFEVWNGKGDPLSCGERWPAGSFGHTGFTGTSVWVDPHKELIVVFLTNAVHFGRNTKIRTIRKTLHSLICSSLTEGIS